MSHYFIKDNRIRFFNLALVMVLLSLLVSLLSKIQYQLEWIISHQEAFMMAMTQISILLTWIYMGVNEMNRFIRQILIPFPLFHIESQCNVPLDQSILIKVLHHFNQQHQHMVMRC
jgi:hypothetical protein